jgi:hypothetical protein
MHRWGSQSTIWAPIATSLSVKNIRLGYIQSWKSTLPRLWVAVTMAMLIRSVGNAGHGITRTSGMAPPSSGSTTRR